MEEDSQPSPEIPAEGIGSDRSRIRFELRTPINHILGYCEMLLEDGETPEAFRPDLEKIHLSGKRLTHLIDELLSEGGTSDGADNKRLLHDLRTPINHIIGYSEMLAEEAADEGMDQFESDLGRIKAAAETWLVLMQSKIAGKEDRAGKPQEEDAAQLFDSLQDSSSGTVDPEKPAETGRILVVDDDEQNRDMLARRLEKNGHRVETAVDGESALEALKNDRFDLVLLDMIMPGISGVEVLQRMKSEEGLKDIPVIVISALDDESGMARCIELGAEDYLGKPFNPVVLKARIGTSLEKHRLREAEQRHLAQIKEEQRKSERLLLNILPGAVAERLKDGEEAIADLFPEVTVLFGDLVDFTQMSSSHKPEDIVGMLNRIFSSFDLIADKHHLEKIKTIGDAYMVVGGLPVPRDDHVEAIASFALDILDEIDQINEEFEIGISLRIGIATGPVVAGIIGRNKFIYDLWGDTVNTASRMESHGQPGKIQVTEDTWSRLKSKPGFDCTPRGEIPVKGKGTMKTWFLARAEV